MYTVKMIDKETQEVRSIPYPERDWEESGYYLWADGNWSCDCNRGLDWFRSKGDDAAWDLWFGGSYCKGLKRFFVLEIITPDGKVVYGPEEGA